MKPVVNRLKKQYKGKVEFRLINIDKDAEGAALWQQFTPYVPAFLFINTDGTTADLKVGEFKEQQLRAALDALK